jgi:uncharacterized protein (UPF0276 family)
LGLRRSLMGPLQQTPPECVDFFEVAPENWIGIGGKMGKDFRRFTERYPFVAHGLSLSIGSPSALDETFLQRVRRLLDEHNFRFYTEHLSYCSDDGHLYDLMPIPFTEEAVHYVAGRIRRVQDILERRIAMENVSYYAAPGKEMEEIEFLNAVLKEADCDLLLDVNNIYVNSINHGYNAEEFLKSLPAERIAYCHIAGHYDEADDLKVDTHGAEVIEPVWSLLETAYQHFGVFPTLLERDFNIPPLPQLLTEVSRISSLQSRWNDNHDGDIAHGTLA